MHPAHVPISFPVAGSWTSKVLPEAAGVHLPSMKHSSMNRLCRRANPIYYGPRNQGQMLCMIYQGTKHISGMVCPMSANSL